MDIRQSRKTKFACYYVYLAMASVFSLPPLLFATFRDMYGISYTLLGTLVLVNFCTQLGIDLVFSFFTKYFNIHRTIRLMPLLTAVGLCIYALVPLLLPEYAYLGFLVGTFLFSVAAGLGEVLVSPTVAALPSDNPEADLSALHSLYGYGFVGVVLTSTLFLHFVGHQYWMYLTLFWAALPVIASVLLMNCQLPQMDMGHSGESAQRSKHRTHSLLLCVGCIFLGSCTENTMSNWISVYMESALHLPKAVGDIFGMALFAMLLGLTRSAYAKYGKNILNVLIWGTAGAAVCYVIAAVSPSPILSLAACAAVGICSSMLWPGTLILMEEKIPGAGVAAYALMAAGGDFGAALAPQGLGILVDNIALSGWAADLAPQLSMSAEQLGLKTGMLVAVAFPILGLLLLGYMKRYFRKNV